jgi:hypothetical protein
MTMPHETSQQRPTEQRLSTADFAAATEQQPIERRPEDRSARTPLFAEHEGSDFRTRWSDVQASFVDEPRQAVEQADSLVAEVMQRLAHVFADERQRLEQQWDRDGETNTEELRLALQRYRSFFDRLLSM